MAASPNSFVWYELLTTDTKAAEAFYRSVMGWNIQDSGLTDRSYSILSVGETGMGGMMVLPEQARATGARPGWMGYIAVDDVDAYTARVKKAGGTIYKPAEDIPNVGRFSVVGDPQGAAFVLFKPLSDQQPTPPKPGTPGYAGWRELMCSDLPSAVAFYTELFGWGKGTAVDMGPMGVYQLFTINGVDVGGMMKKPDAVPVTYWGYYFNVDKLNAALDRVKTHGGQLINGPDQVPGGSWIANCLDPQGAVFSLVGPTR